MALAAVALAGCEQLVEPTHSPFTELCIETVRALVTTPTTVQPLKIDEFDFSEWTAEMFAKYSEQTDEEIAEQMSHPLIAYIDFDYQNAFGALTRGHIRCEVSREGELEEVALDNHLLSDARMALLKMKLISNGATYDAIVRRQTGSH